LENEHGIVIDYIEETEGVDEKRQGYLYVDGVIVFVDGFTEDGSAREYKFHYYKGNQVEYPSKVVIEEEKLGVVQNLASLDESLMFSLDDILAGGKVLCKDFTIILILFTFLCEIVIFHPNHLWLLLVIYLI
jgi:hypothetical protein